MFRLIISHVESSFIKGLCGGCTLSHLQIETRKLKSGTDGQNQLPSHPAESFFSLSTPCYEYAPVAVVYDVQGRLKRQQVCVAPAAVCPQGLYCL